MREEYVGGLDKLNDAADEYLSAEETPEFAASDEATAGDE